ncbi:hypothetical protein LX16_3503 [Stackebrandtia albiflava]|uniref:Uncharacterized protein n=1 Tax=Stackebrandtia albiflava TaxID=406432 RepID=A0A562V4B5_9ACTN|nr:hypothetical protein LX16_3503 [Stackebrandtia albiflava]
MVDLPTELMSRLRDLVGGELLHRFITAAVAERLRESTGDHPGRPGGASGRP